MNHSMHKRLAAATMGIAAGLVLAGCSAPSDAPEGDVTLRMLVNISPVLTVEYYESLVAPFEEANPGIDVEIEVPSGENVQTTLQQELASGDIPDVVASQLNAVVAPQLAVFPEEDWVLDTPLVEENTIDGNIVSVATGQQAQSLVFYNKAAFDAAGINEIPTSVDDFTAALVSLKEAGYVPLQTSGEWTTGPQFSIAASPDLLGDDPDWFAQRNAGGVSFVGSAWGEYLEHYQGWIVDGLVLADALGVKYPDGIAAFASGEVGTYIMPNFVIPTIEEAAPSFEVGVFSTPTLDGSTAKQVAVVAQPYSVMKDSKHQEAAMSLVEYLVSDVEAIRTALASESNFRQGVSYEASPLTEAVSQILDASPGSVVGTTTPDTPVGFADELNTQVQSLYTGGSAAGVMEYLDTWWDANATQ